MLNEILRGYKWYDHPEGLKFVETHRDAYRTSGHWLLLPGAVSRFHRWVSGEELWFIHMGRVDLHVIEPSGRHTVVTLGTGIRGGEQAAAAVQASCWQAAELPDGVEFAFGSVVCAPPFSFEDFVAADGKQLVVEFPEHAELIRRLTG